MNLNVLIVSPVEVRPFPPKKGSAEYNTKLYLMVRLLFWRSGQCGVTSLLPSFSGLLCSGVVVSVRVLSMG